MWKAVATQTGFSRADILIKKNKDQTYSGTIVAIRPLPTKPQPEICRKCQGALKNVPYLGLEVIYDFTQNKQNPLEYENGTILDPLDGKVYKGRAKLSENGRRLSLRGYLWRKSIGRSMTWIRAQ